MTLLPLVFVATTTVDDRLLRDHRQVLEDDPGGGRRLKGWLNIGLTVMLLACVAVILVAAFGKWLAVLRPDAGIDPQATVEAGATER